LRIIIWGGAREKRNKKILQTRGFQEIVNICLLDFFWKYISSRLRIEIWDGAREKRNIKILQPTGFQEIVNICLLDFFWKYISSR